MFLLHVEYVPKKVPLGTGTEFQVPIPVLYWLKCVPNPTNDFSFFTVLDIIIVIDAHTKGMFIVQCFVTICIVKSAI